MLCFFPALSLRKNRLQTSFLAIKEIKTRKKRNGLRQEYDMKNASLNG